MKRCEVVVLGAAAVDWVAQMPVLPEVDSIVMATSYQRYAGGAGANIAAGIARLAHEVRFLGKVGADESGRWLIGRLAEIGVDVDWVRIEPGEPSASCFIALDAQGRRMIYALGGAGVMAPEDRPDPAGWKGARALWISDAYPEVACPAAEQIHAGGGTVFFGPGGIMASFGLDGLSSLLRISDVLVVSQSEAHGLTGEAKPEGAVRKLAESGPQIVVETLGSEGVCLYQSGKIVRVPAVAPVQVVDTTGAGDAFAAGLVSGYLEGWGWEQAVRWGCGAAAMKIGHFGAQSGQPTRQELDAFLRKGQGK